jgi:hypothetical protein
LLESFLPRGTREGSKSAGMYLLRTLRSPIFFVPLFGFYAAIVSGFCLLWLLLPCSE